MRGSKVDEDAGMIAPRPDALRVAKRHIDRSVADHDLAAITHWTSVWFKVQEITLGQAIGRDAASKASPLHSIMAGFSGLRPTTAAVVTTLPFGAVVLCDWLIGASASLLAAAH